MLQRTKCYTELNVELVDVDSMHFTNSIVSRTKNLTSKLIPQNHLSVSLICQSEEARNLESHAVLQHQTLHNIAKFQLLQQVNHYSVLLDH